MPPDVADLHLRGPVAEAEAAHPSRSPQLPAADPTEVIARRAVAELYGDPKERGFTVRYWTGAEEAPGGAPSRFTLVLRRPGALRRMFLPPSELGLGEAFVTGEFEVEGDLEAAADLLARIGARRWSLRRVTGLVRLLLRLPRAGGRAGTPYERISAARLHLRGRHTPRLDAAAIRHHYDLGNDFYGLWLDAEQVYSCAYFAEGDEDLDAAQRAKLEYICRKLRLHPGERLLDIGCGWGGLVRYAGRHYGVDAVGITLSRAQADYARQRIAADRLDQRCRIELRDYRDLAAEPTFDKVVSVGMFEHVGRRRLPGYFRAVARVVHPGGLFLNHGIVSLADARPRSLLERAGRRLFRCGRFMDRYVFPGGELLPLGEVISDAEAAGFETRDVESLREHYARTLRHWVRRLEARRAEAEALVSEPTYRVWRLYLAASAHAFASGRIGVVQALLARPDARGRCGLPPSRADLYRDATPVGGNP